jgi:hypothetical protein
MVSRPQPLPAHRVEEQIFIEGYEGHAASRALELKPVINALLVRTGRVIREVDLAASWDRARSTSGENLRIVVPVVAHRAHVLLSFSRAGGRCVETTGRG